MRELPFPAYPLLPGATLLEPPAWDPDVDPVDLPWPMHLHERPACCPRDARGQPARSR